MGMRFGYLNRDRKKSKKEEEDSAPFRKVFSYSEDEEGKKIKDARAIYSIWSAAKYVLILSLLLWWLPMFGQMIAGYVGGRKAGAPWKGVIAAFLPVIAIFAVIVAFEKGILPEEVFGVSIRPSAIMSSLASSVPFIGPYIDFTREYVGQFVSALEGTSPYGMNSYVLTVAFAYIGGIIADQNRREIEYTSGAVTSNTTVLMPPNQMPSQGVSGGMVQSMPIVQQGNGPHIVPEHARFSRRRILDFLNPFSRQQARNSPRRFNQLVTENKAANRVVGADDIVEGMPKRLKIRGIEKDQVHKRSKGRSGKRRKTRIELARKNRNKRDWAEPSAKRSRRGGRKSGRYFSKKRGSRVTAHRHTDRKPMKINAKAPKSLRRAHKMIEREWNQGYKRGKKRGTKKRTSMSDMRSISRGESESERNENDSRPRRKTRPRSWDTM